MKSQTAFTPLRIALIIFIIIVDILAILSYGFSGEPWARITGIFATVFILMFVFLILLELVWLVSFKNQQTDSVTIKSYKKAINIYLTLFPIGFFLVYLVLMYKN